MANMVKRGTVEFAAHQAVNVCLQVQPGETVVIITDSEKKKGIADPIATAVHAVGGRVKMFEMEYFGARPSEPDETHPALAFPDAIAAAMKEAQVSVFCAGDRAGEGSSFRGPMLDLVTEFKLRHAHMPGINEIAMKMGMCVDYAALQKFTARVREALLGTKVAHLTTPSGTDLLVEFGDNEWCVDDGDIQPGVFGNLPAGETFTYARTANGRIVVTGFIGDAWDRNVQETPITLEVKDGRVVSLKCPADEKLEAELLEYIHQDAEADRFAEFAVGTNMGVTEFIGGLLQVEKAPTVHVAIGDGYEDETGCPWKSDAHLDLVLMQPTLVLDDGRITIFQDGKFNPELLGE